MTRGTTPTIIVTLPDSVALQTAAHLYATVRQGGVLLRKADGAITIDGHSVSFALTQAETLALKASIDAEVQLNWTYENGTRGCTRIARLPVEENLEGEVPA